MNLQKPNRRSDQDPQKQGGFTLIEVVITVVLLAMITGALSAAFVTSLSATSSTRQRVDQSNDAQLVAAFLTRDAQATGGINPGTDSPDTTLGVSTTDNAGCNPMPGTLVVRFKWNDPSSPTTTHVADYSYDSAAKQLDRTVCVSGGAAATTVLANNLISTTSPTSPFAWCNGNESQTCPFLPNTVSLRVTESNPVINATAPYSFTLNASVRPQNVTTVDTTTPTPLVVLGRTNCGNSDATTGLGVLLGTLHVYGRTYVNAHDNGGSCPAMNLVLGAAFTSGVTSLVSGGSCNQVYSNPCPSAPFLTKNNPAIDNPYANLPALNPTALGLAGPKASCSDGPGIYPNTLSITSNCTLAPGVYVLHNGISISNGASLSGTGVLLYIDNGAFNDNAGGPITLSGLAGNTPATAPYAGLVIWKSDSSTISCSGLFTNSSAGVCFQGVNFFGNSDTSIQGVVYTPLSSVVSAISIDTTTSFTGVVAQAFVVQEGVFGAETDVGTPSAVRPNITTTTLPSWTVNRPYPSTTLAVTGGTPPYWWTATGLPTGLTIDGASGTISGTPTATGTASVNIAATDILGEQDTQGFNLTINAAPTITTSSLPSSTVNRDYPSTPLAVSGGTANYTWSAMGLPTGMTISAAGVITGHPTTTGTSSVTVNLVDKAGATTSRTYSLTINPPPTITGPSTLPSPWTSGAVYTATTVGGANGTTPYFWTASGLPTGLNIGSGSGTITGTPSVQGTFTPTITLQDASGATVSQTYSIVINAPLGIGTSLPNGEQGHPYNYTVPATGGVAPYTFTTTGTNLPTGLSISTAGVITGTPTVVGAKTVTLKVTDSVGAVKTQTATLTVAAPVNISGPATLPNWTIQQDYPGTAIVVANGVAPFTWSATGLPAGLGINPSTGVVSGTPTATGSSSIVITVVDSYGVSDTQNYTVTINPVPSISTTSLPSGEQTVSYSTTVAGSGGTTPYTWTANGLSGTGLSINSSTGVISGIPTATGPLSVTVTLTDAAFAPVSHTFTLTVAQGPSSGTTSLPNGEVSVVYPTTTLSATSGTGPYTWTQTGLPGGLTLTGATGVIAGTPTASGTFSNVNITVHDSLGGSSTMTYTVIIAPAPSITTGTTLPPAAVNQPYQGVTMTGAGGTTPYTWSSTTLPTGLSIDPSSGSITGAATTAGTFNAVSIKLTDASGAAVTKTFSITVDPQATVTSISPTSRGLGAQNQTITINGTGFVAGSQLAAVFSNPGITVVSTTRVTAIKLTAVINISGSAATGPGTLSVNNGDGGTASGSATFTVNGGPTIIGVNPTTRGHSNSTFTVTITGTGFTAATTVAFNTTAGTSPTIFGTPTVNTATQTITMTVQARNASTNTIVVTNTDGGSASIGFSVT